MAEILYKDGTPLVVDTPEALSKALGEGYAPENKTVSLRDPVTNNYVEAAPEEVQAHLNNGLKLASEGAKLQQAKQSELQQDYGDWQGKLEAFGQGGLGTLTFGGSDYLLDKAGLTPGKYAEANPGYRAAGEITGAVASLGAGGEGAVGKALSYTPAGATNLLGRAAASSIGTGSAAARLIGLSAEGGIDGSLYGAGQAVSEAVLDDKPLTVEAVANSMGHGLWVGSAFGGLLGAAGETARILNKPNLYNDLAPAMEAKLNAVGKEAEGFEATLGKERPRNFKVKDLEPGFADDGIAPNDWGAHFKKYYPEEYALDQADKARYAAKKAGREAAGKRQALAFEGDSIPEPIVGESVEAGTAAGKRIAKGSGPISPADTSIEFPQAMGPFREPVPENLSATGILEGPPKFGSSEVAEQSLGTQIDINPAGQARRGAVSAAEEIPQAASVGRTPISPFEGIIAEGAQAAKAARSEQIKLALGEFKAAHNAIDPAAYKVSKLVRRDGEEALDLAAKWGELGQKAQALDEVAGTNFSQHVSTPASLNPDLKPLGDLDDMAIAKALDVPVEKVREVLPNLTPSAKQFLDAVAVSKGLDSGLAGKALQTVVQGAKLAGAVGLGIPLGIAKMGLGPRAVSSLVNRGARVLGIASRAGNEIKQTVDSVIERIYSAADRPLTAIYRGAGQAGRLGGAAEIMFSDDHHKEGESTSEAQIRQVREITANPEDAIQRIDESMLPIRGMHSKLGYALANKRYEQYQYLAANAPSVETSKFNNTSIKPGLTPIQEAEWQRTVRAVTTPLAALEQEISDKTLSTQTVTAVQTLFPELYAKVQQRLLLKLQTSPPLAYEQRIVASKLLGGNFEPSLGATMAVQAMYQQNNQQQAAPVKGVPKSAEQPTTAQRIESK